MNTSNKQLVWLVVVGSLVLEALFAMSRIGFLYGFLSAGCLFGIYAWIYAGVSISRSGWERKYLGVFCVGVVSSTLLPMAMLVNEFDRRPVASSLATLALAGVWAACVWAIHKTM